MEKEKKQEKTIQSISRAAQILRCFIGNSQLSLTDISKETGINVNTVAGLVRTLKLEGFLESQGNNSCLQLGPELFHIAANTKRNEREIILPYMKELNKEIGEAVSLSVRSGAYMLFLEQVRSMHMYNYAPFIGETYPFYCSGSGKAFFAFLPEFETEKEFNNLKIEKHTKNTITKYEDLLEDFTLIRSRGYAIDNCELEEGLRGVTVPIFDFGKKPIAVVAVAGPVSRLTDERIPEIANMLLDISKKVSNKLFL